MKTDKRIGVAQTTIFLMLLLGIAGALGWLVGQVGIELALRVAGALVLPALLMVGMAAANKARHGGLTLVLTLALWALAAVGVWGLMR